MKRNQSMDVLRAIALLFVLVYHCWVLCGAQPFKYSGVTLIVALGGEIGVTLFFALSGYGMFCSIKAQQDKGNFRYGNYLKKRLLRIGPQYYTSLLIVVLMSVSSYCSMNGIKNIVSHALFIHNLSPVYCGSINGVLWTMGVIVQFYLIAPLLYKSFERFGIKIGMVYIIATIVFKYLSYTYYLPYVGHVGEWEFWCGRQLLPNVLDNFTIGMFAAYLIHCRQIKISEGIKWAMLVLSTVGGYFVCSFGMKNGIHTHNWSGYIWHSCLAICLGLIMFFGGMLKIGEDADKSKFVGTRFLLWLSKYEYGIYVWHLLILNYLIGRWAYLQGLMETEYVKLMYVYLIAMFCGVGYISTKVIDCGFLKLFFRRKGNIK